MNMSKKPDLVQEMQRLAEEGVQVWVRNDTHRDSSIFTILLHGERYCDTDDPAGVLATLSRTSR
jgi:hypothetical protein